MLNKKVLLGAVAASGLMMGSAWAGALDIRVINVNGSDAADGMDGDGTLQGPVGTLRIETTETTVEEPIVYTPQRITTADKPLQLHVELETYDTDVATGAASGLPTFSGDEVYKVDIELLGMADPVFKLDISPNEIVRPGTDEVYSESAEGFPAGALIKEDTKAASFFLTPSEVSESAIGYTLPVELRNCGDFNVRISYTTFVGTFQNVRTVTTGTGDNDPIATCDPENDSIIATAITNDVLVDLGDAADPFSMFIAPDGTSGKGFDLSNMVEFGMVDLKIIHDVFDAKKKNEENGDASSLRARVFDVTDIEEYTLQYTFENVDGLDTSAFVLLDGPGGSVCSTADFDGVVATFTLDESDIATCFGITAPTDDADLMFDGEAILKLMATVAVDDPIVQQAVALSDHSVTFDMPAFMQDDDSLNMLVSGITLQDPLEDAFRIIRRGLNFGAFDWVADPGSKVQSVFRVTGIPDTPPDAAAPYTSGVLMIENSQTGADGVCPFDLADQGITNGEVVVNLQKFEDIVSNPLCFRDGEGLGPLDDFGRADMTWSFYIPTSEGDKVDVDRLLWSPGDVFADYGDNGNDSNSIKARSCDAGRFGPHVANNLSGAQADILLALCIPPGSEAN